MVQVDETANRVLPEWELVPIAGRIGVEVRHADLRQQLTARDCEQLHQLIATHGVVVFSGQSLDNEAHRELARQLGQPKLPPDYIPTLANQGFPEISVISTENGVAYTSDQWHSDVTWMTNPPRYSILNMILSPPVGGDTMWSSQIVAYEHLSSQLQQLLTGMTASHQLPRTADRSSVHPVVCVHPLTGKKALFINSVFTRQICELRQSESDSLLALLYEHTTRPEWVCRWRWSVGDLAIWDNHFVQHYAINDYGPATRRIHRIEVEGQPPIGAKAAWA
jgi:taurine dioxygenase